MVEITPGAEIMLPQLPDLARQIGRPLTWAALLTIKGHPYHLKTAAAMAAAQADGIDIRPQVSCRPLRFQVTLDAPFGFGTAPVFAEVLGLDHEAKKARYADPQWRGIAQEALDTARTLRPNWTNYLVAESSSHPELIGRSIADLAAETGTRPLDVMIELALSEDLATRFDSILANDDQDGIAYLLQQPGMLIGLADSGAHVGQLCDAALFTDLLGNWVREREVLPLATAVHRLTGEPADFFGFAGRGYVREGYAADLVVFDPATVGPGPVRRVADFPAGAERLTADAPTGMRHVVVNGTVIREDERTDIAGTEAAPGHLVRPTQR